MACIVFIATLRRKALQLSFYALFFSLCVEDVGGQVERLDLHGGTDNTNDDEKAVL